MSHKHVCRNVITLARCICYLRKNRNVKILIPLYLAFNWFGIGSAPSTWYSGYISDSTLRFASKLRAIYLYEFPGNVPLQSVTNGLSSSFRVLRKQCFVIDYQKNCSNLSCNCECRSLYQYYAKYFMKTVLRDVYKFRVINGITKHRVLWVFVKNQLNLIQMV